MRYLWCPVILSLQLCLPGPIYAVYERLEECRYNYFLKEAGTATLRDYCDDDIIYHFNVTPWNFSLDFRGGSDHLCKNFVTIRQLQILELNSSKLNGRNIDDLLDERTTILWNCTPHYTYCHQLGCRKYSKQMQMYISATVLGVLAIMTMCGVCGTTINFVKYCVLKTDTE